MIEFIFDRVMNVNDLSIEQLSRGMLAVRANASSLLEDAKCLRSNGRTSRAYALAYMACEEYGKLPILIGLATRLALEIPIDWKQAKKRFYSHNSKASQFLGLARAMPMLLEAVAAGEKIVDSKKLMQKAAVGAFFGPSLFASRNAAVYCDFTKDAFISPSEQIVEEMVDVILTFAEANQTAADTVLGNSVEEIATMIRTSASRDRYDENEAESANIANELRAAFARSKS